MEKQWTKIFREIYTKKINNSQQVEDIISNANKTLELTKNNQGEPKNDTGLIVGKIQSGKTSNFLAISASALDNDYDIVVVFVGTDNKLKAQNVKRIKEIFNKECSVSPDDIISGNVGTNVNVLDTATIKNNDFSDFNRVLDQNEKAIITVLKNTTHLENLKNWFKNSDQISNKNVLLIDDEGDQGSLNTKATNEANKEFYCGDENDDYNLRSRWNMQIKELTNELAHYFYLSVTATPYVNVLIDPKDNLSPIFIKLTRPGKGYKGLEDFHNEDYREKKMNIIANDELDIIQNLGEFNPSLSFLKLDSLKKSLSTFIASFFFLNLSKGKKRDAEGFPSAQMLVNADIKKGSHKILSEVIDKIRKYYLNLVNDKSDINYLVFKDFIKLGLDNFLNFQEELEWDPYEKRNWYIIENFYANYLNSLKIIILNSDTDYELEEESESKNELKIYVGSVMLGRGITLENLLVTYFALDPKTKQVDTTLQRARWFGYREEIFPFIRLFLTINNDKVFALLKDVEIDFWNNLEELEEIENNIYDDDEKNGTIILDKKDQNYSLYKDYIKNIELPVLPGKVTYTGRNRISTTSQNVSGWKTQQAISEKEEFVKNEVRDFTQFIKSNSYSSDFPLNDPTRYRIIDYDTFECFSKSIDKFLYRKILQKTNIVNSEILNKNHKNNILASQTRIILLNKFNEDAIVPSIRTETNKNNKEHYFQFFGYAVPRDEIEKRIKNNQYIGDKNIGRYDSNKGKVLVVVNLIELTTDEDNRLEPQVTYSIYVPGLALPAKTIRIKPTWRGQNNR